MTRGMILLLLLSILQIHVGEGSQIDQINRTISDEEFHLSRDAFSINEKKRPSRRIQDEDDDEDDGDLHVNFLTACIMPFRTYVPSEENKFRIPYGNVRITFDGGQGNFNKITRGKYPGYNPNLEFTFQYDLQGLPSFCEKCRIQVTEGDNCEDPGIRYWDRSVEGADNPWRPEWGAVYSSNKHGQARGYFSMFDGFNFDAHKSRTVVVFAENAKTRLGCGVIRRREYGECGLQPIPDPSVMPSQAPITITVPPNIMPQSAMPVARPTPVSFAPSSPIDPEITVKPSTVTAKPTGEATARPTPQVTARPTAQVTARPTPQVTARPTPVATYRPTEKPPSYDPPPSKGGKGGMGSSSKKNKSGKMKKRQRARYTRGWEQ
mmetsp:Transcript_558/g.922  ORF Transcript_558/g.922 Transcript_558/m.922 type:complete len:378 (+) Transcript_558:29-1162(+)|eukprot:CAMPEP_0119014740 /NCGR_PEP_ID=MMETSP1176-20130426/10339_1 /TAXON_ID=265551 /ORGANISM="Synedropsis recta cf, Strain CCMP1620" /LENGTH=377 /DNA_ID=CAMNT_0006967977 /DNA_START=5 /DNA_END=1138 /DNA_ORIENTATION=+